MASGTFDYFRRGSVLPSGNVKTDFDYFRVGEPIALMGEDGFSYEASGGMVVVVSNLQNKFFYEASGKITASNNNVTVKCFYKYVPVLGKINLGDAAFARLVTEFAYVARFGGLGVSALRMPAETTDVASSHWEYTAHFGGSRVSALRVTGGTAVALGSYHAYTASGGFSFKGGTATIVAPIWVYTASGGIHASATVPTIVYRGPYTPVQQAQPHFGGTALASVPRERIASGGAVLSGSAAVMVRRQAVASGGAKTGGTAPMTLGTLVMVAGGRIKTGGAAQIEREYDARPTNTNLGGTAHAACSYWQYTAVPSSKNLYAPSYYELIDHQAPVGFWIKSDTVASTLTNFGSAGVDGTATLNGSPVFGLLSLIPNQKDGNAMRFDWINTYARNQDSDFLAPTAERTISAIVRLYDVTTRSFLYGEGNSISGHNLYVFNGKLIFHVWEIDPPIFDSVTIEVSINPNQNYHILATIDCASNTMKLFVDGVQIGSASMFATPIAELPQRSNMSFGAKVNGTRYNDTVGGGFATSSSSPGNGHWLRGNIQAVATWDRVLSSTEIALQQGARAARYSSTSENVFPYSASGVIQTGGTTTVSLEVETTLWTYVAGGAAVFGGTTVATSDALASFATVAAGRAVLGGSASVETIVSYYSYSSGGGVKFGGASDASAFTFQSVASGNMVLSGVSTASMEVVLSYSASGGMSLTPFARADYTMEVERNITWNISRGVLRYYRVEGAPKPYNCPPLGGSVCRSDQCVQWFMNVSAHSVSEVCAQLRKLKIKGPVRKISVFSRPVLKTDEDPTVDYTCNTLVDVGLPTCDDLFLEYDIVVTAEATAYAVFTEDFSYVSGGRIASGGVSGMIFDQWYYVASGSIVTGNEAGAYYPGLVIVSTSGKANLGGTATYYTNALGTQVVQASASASASLIEAIFGSDSSNALVPPDEMVDSTCCGELPDLLFMTHQIDRFAKLDKFLFINSLSVRRNLNLVYSAKKNIWYNNIHFKGTGVTNDPEIWDITTEFGCVDDFDGIPIQGTLWGFSFTVMNRNLRTNADNYTRIVLGFDPELVCTLDNAIDSIFAVNVRDQSTNPVTLRAVVLYDEIGLFKNRSFINSPTIKFRVVSTPVVSPLSNLNITNSLQELLL